MVGRVGSGIGILVQISLGGSRCSFWPRVPLPVITDEKCRSTWCETCAPRENRNSFQTLAKIFKWWLAWSSRR